ncbi:hypothetical protein KPH14_006070 [Odynerus spinipes]|uniref:Regulator of microtubule dynamics protein 1 n=1 Tax=Odynerus spinipes TaxID=1348599 RepID=A0AAD9RK93_9HYME|nr:hypothetical protein KPH14_006070 [Odynerus spinipes]
MLRFMNIIKTCRKFSGYQAVLALQKGSQRSKFNRLFYGAPTIMGLWTLKSVKDDKKPTEEAMRETLLIKADALFDQGLYKQLYDLLSNYKDSKDVEMLWRLSRVLYNMSKTSSESEAKEMILEGYHLIETALTIKEDHYAVHKWMSILLDSKSAMDGMKARIQQLYNVKQHMLRAIELNPKDATTLHMLGTWCYQVSDLAWYQRKIAAIVFGEPPRSSFEEALMYFSRAEETNPNFYSQNLLMLAKTYLKLGKREDALRYLKLTTEYPTTNHEDVQAKKEAQELLHSF